MLARRHLSLYGYTGCLHAYRFTCLSLYMLVALDAYRFICLSLPIPQLLLSHAFEATLRGFQCFSLSREIRDTKTTFLSKQLPTEDIWFIIHYKYYF